MKQICALAGLVFIAVFPAHGAFQEKSFWTERAKKLAADRASLASSGALDKTLAAVLDGELARAERMISDRGDSSSYSAAGTTSPISASAAYAAYLLRETVNDLPSPKEETRAVAALRTAVEKRFESKGITPDKKFINSFMSRLSAQEKTLISFECGIGARKRAFTSKTAATENALPHADSFGELQRHFADNPVASPAMEDMNAADSSVASGLIRDADEYARALNDAREFLGSKGLIADASTLAQSAAKTGEMGKNAFTRLSVKLIDTTRFDRTTGKSAGEVPPREPDMHAVFAEMDRARLDAISPASSKGNDTSAITDADSKMRAAISRGVSESAGVLFGAEERPAIIGGKETAKTADTRAENRSATAKEVLRVKIMKAHEYREANLRFIRLAERMKSVSGKNHIPSPYAERIRSLKAIAAFITDLDARVRQSGSPELDSIRRALIPREKAFYENVSALSAVPYTERVLLGKDDLKIALELRSSFTKEIQSSVGSLRANDKPAGIAVASKEISSRQDDENALSDSIRAWTAAINGSRKMDALLAAYSSLFTECERDAKNGRVTGRLGKVFDDNSLIPSLNGTFAQEIRDEDIRHTFMAGWLKGDISRLNTIHATDTTDKAPMRSLSDEEMKSARDALTSHAPVRISAWTLTPNTLRKTDANAVAYLSKLFARTSAQQGSVPMRKVVLSDAQYAFSIDIPKYYEDAASAQKIRMHTVMSGVYTDLPRASAIHFLVVPNNDKGTRSVLEEYLGSVSMKAVKWKESNTENSGSLTVIGSGNGDVIEASAVERGGMIVIIAGTSPKNRYRTLSAALKTANDSLKSAIGE